LSPVGKRGSVSGARVVVVVVGAPAAAAAAAAHESGDVKHAHGEGAAAPVLLPWWPPVLRITPM
jgi:hypothetical protein